MTISTADARETSATEVRPHQARGALSPEAPERQPERQPERPPRRRSGRRWVAALAGLAAGALVAATGYAVSASRAEQSALGPGVVTVEVGMEMSAFDIGALRVREGTLVQFVVRNDDPIDHELVIGDAEVHRAHATGTEHRHPPVPGEVSVAPGDIGTTFYEFTEPGTVVYACHLPGHVAYGMQGTIEVVPAA